jgi:hypothetical protein
MDTRTERGERDTTFGAAPFVSGPDMPSAPLFQPLTFDASKYLHYIADEGLSEAQATALLRAYWDIYVGFVDIAFGIDPVQQVVDRLPDGTGSASVLPPPVLSSFHHASTTDDQIAAPGTGGAANEEDS